MSKLKQKLFSLLLLLTLTLFTGIANADTAKVDNASQNSSSVSQIQTRNQKPPRKNQILFKFLISMLWVGGSVVVIYLLLTAYKKYFPQSVTLDENKIPNEQNLNSPNNIDEAVNLFIEKF